MSEETPNPQPKLTIKPRLSTQSTGAETPAESSASPATPQRAPLRLTPQANEQAAAAETTSVPTAETTPPPASPSAGAPPPQTSGAPRKLNLDEVKKSVRPPMSLPPVAKKPSVPLDEPLPPLSSAKTESTPVWQTLIAGIAAAGALTFAYLLYTKR